MSAALGAPERRQGLGRHSAGQRHRQSRRAQNPDQGHDSEHARQAVRKNARHAAHRRQKIQGTEEQSQSDENRHGCKIAQGL